MYNVGGEDYKEIRNEALIFDNDTTIQTVMVSVFEDNIEEDTEEFFLALMEHSRIVKRLDLRIMTSFASIFINGKLVSSNILSVAMAITIWGWEQVCHGGNLMVFPLDKSHTFRHPSLNSYNLLSYIYMFA